MVLTRDLWRAGVARRLPRAFPYSWVQGVLIVLLAVQFARIFWAAFTPLGPVGTPASGPRTVGGNIAALTTFDPFFRVSGATGATIVTSLPVKLFGVRVNQATGGGSAIIATPDGVQQSFAVGDEIMPGIRLKAVAQDNVTIDRGGTSEQLFLDQSVPAPVAAVSAPGAPPAVVPPVAASLSANIAFAPRLEKGAVTGFVVSPKGSGEAFRAAGFQAGDIVTQINGAGFRSVQEAADALAKVPANTLVTFSVERGDKVVTLSARAGQ